MTVYIHKYGLKTIVQIKKESKKSVWFYYIENGEYYTRIWRFEDTDKNATCWIYGNSISCSRNTEQK